MNGQEEVRLSRVERRKQDTRARILIAAESLMRSRSIDGITIRDITEAADVGHGSFYLHFKSKYEVLIPIVQGMAEELDTRLRGLLANLTDPAEIMAVSGRHMGRMIVADELWRWTLLHAAVPVQEMQNAIGRFSQRDFNRGHQTGRLLVNDVAAASSFALGGYVNCLMSAFNEQDAHQRIDDGVEIMLRVFGLSIAEAKRIAHQSLPILE